MLALASKATTYQKIQVAYMYANSMLDYGRQLELRTRLGVICMHILSFIMGLLAWVGVMYRFEPPPGIPSYLIVVGKVALGVCILGLAYLNLRLNSLMKHIAKLNDASAEGLMEVMEEHFKKRVED